MKYLESQLAAAWNADRWQDVTVLVAVSGGADSVALVRALAAMRPSGAAPLVVAHFNHGLRGRESDADEQFVVELARQLNFPSRIGRAPAAASPVGEGTAAVASEDESRQARYTFLIATAQDIGARYVATAHTADDQVETVLHRILRGTGLAGLAAMPRARELSPGIALVRPLLNMRRAEVREYLAEIHQPCREDSSNLDQSYTRNRLRHDLLPKLTEEYNPRIADALLRLSSLAADAQQIIDEQAADLAARCLLKSEPNTIVIDTSCLDGASDFLVREMLITAWRTQGWPLQAMGAAEWDALATLVTAHSVGQEKRVFPGAILAERTGSKVTIAKEK
jgi:tRNA(Ile)-lysidine synthase